MIEERFDLEHCISELHPNMRYFILAARHIVLHKVFLEIITRKSLDSVFAEHHISLSLHPVGGMGHLL